MKTLLIIGIIVLGVSGQAMSMGHPHNIFAARKQMQAKASVLAHKPKASVAACWQPMVSIDRQELSKRLLTALSNIRPARSY